MDYGALDAAFKAWAVEALKGTPIDATRVLWAYQTVTSNARPVGGAFLSLQLGPSVPLGIDGYTSDFDAARPAGKEIRISTVAMRGLTLTVQCFGGTPAGNGSALAMATRLRDRTALPGVRNILTAAGIAPFGTGDVRAIPAITGTKFEARAMFELRCYVDATETDYTGYIQHVTLGGKIDGQTVGPWDVDAN